MTDFLTLDVVEQIKERGAYPVGALYQTLKPIPGYDLVMLGGSFLRSAWPAVAGMFASKSSGVPSNFVSRTVTGPSNVVLRKLVAGSNGTVLGITSATTASGGNLVKITETGAMSFCTGITNGKVYKVAYANGVWIASTSTGVYRSVDDGASFTLVHTPALSTYWPFCAVYLGGSNWCLLLAESTTSRNNNGQVDTTSTKRFYKITSSDNGASWGAATLLLDFTSNVYWAQGAAPSVRLSECAVYKLGNKWLLLLGVAMYSTSDSSYTGAPFNGVATLWGENADFTGATTDIAMTITGSTIVDSVQDYVTGDVYILMANNGEANAYRHRITAAGVKGSELITYQGFATWGTPSFSLAYCNSALVACSGNPSTATNGVAIESPLRNTNSSLATAIATSFMNSQAKTPRVAARAFGGLTLLVGSLGPDMMAYENEAQYTDYFTVNTISTNPPTYMRGA